MSTLRDMENELVELLSRCIRQRDEDTLVSLAEQEEELNGLECNEPALGRWLDHNDFPFLIETLMLDDDLFSEEYPGVRLGFEERKRFAATLEEHCERCERCGRKRALDLEWKASVDSAFAENKGAIARVIARAAGKD